MEQINKKRTLTQVIVNHNNTLQLLASDLTDDGVWPRIAIVFANSYLLP